jgi:hypothetical protein
MSVPEAACEPGDRPLENRWTEWTLLSAVVTLAVLVGAGRLPQQAKIPVVLPVGLAALVGFGLGLVADRWRLSPARRVKFTIAGCVAIALVLNAVDTHRRLAAFIRQQPPPQRADVAGIDQGFRDLLEQGGLPEGEGTVSNEDLRRSLAVQERRTAELLREREFLQTFRGYLAFRVPREWGTWPWGACVLFWLAEVTVAALVAGRVGEFQIQTVSGSSRRSTIG